MGFEVVRDPPAVGDHGRDSLFESLRGLSLAEVLEHQLSGQDHRGRVHFVQPFVPRRRAMRGLEHGHARSDVRPWSDAEPAHQPGGDVRDDVPVQVRQHEHVELLGALDELHAECVDEHLAGGDLRIVARDLAEDRKEEPVGELHDVRLRHAGDLAAVVGSRIVEGEADDPLGGCGSDRLDGDSRAARDLLRLERVQRGNDPFGCVEPASYSMPA